VRGEGEEAEEEEEEGRVRVDVMWCDSISLLMPKLENTSSTKQRVCITRRQAA
jgi:hypothetical protein